MDRDLTSPDHAGSSSEEQLRVACNDLSDRLRQGEDCRAEAYLDDPTWNKEHALELIYTEFVVRQELGESRSESDWLRRFPDWQDDLAEIFEVHRFVCAEEAVPLAADTDAIVAQPTVACDQADEAGAHGLRIVGYDLLDELGRGGMGVVYRARQRSVNRIVALKMIRSGGFEPDEFARFQNETQAAARLHHPNIVEVFEAGEQNGSPYLAMEYVDGLSLDGLLAKAPITAKSAAQLAHALAEAVQYAHQRGVIHRDLKPSNILMTADGVPKITDFGLAKQFGRADDSELTQTGVVLGTPSYMPPEQAVGDTRKVTQAADIYALGAVLYEMLSARPPFVSDSALETLRLVKEQPPLAPRQLDPSLPVDIETICLRCLEKEPLRRYATAEDVADELQRFLAGEPILARPVSTLTRLGRWCRRKPAIAGMLVAIFTLLTALAAGGSWFGWRQSILRAQANEESLRAIAAEKLADQSAAEANAVTDYLVETFRSPDPWLDGKDVTVSKAADNAIASLDEDWPEDNAAKAALIEAFAKTKAAWGDYAEALELANRAYEMRTRIEGAGDVATLRAMLLVAEFRMILGELLEAERLASAAHQQLQSQFGDEHETTIKAASILGLSRLHQGDIEGGAKILEANYQRARKQLGRFHMTAQITFNEVVIARHLAGDTGQLTEMLRSELEAAHDQFDDDSMVIVGLVGHLADSLRIGGDVHEAVELYESNVNRTLRTLGDEHPTTLTTMNNLAAGYAAAGQIEKCVEVTEQILPIRQRRLGQEHPHTLHSMHNLGMSYYNVERYEESLAMLQDAVRLREQVLGTDHPDTLVSRAGLGAVLVELDRSEEAIALLEENRTTMREVYGPDHHETLDNARGLAAAYNAAKQFDKARLLLESTRQTLIERFGEDNRRTLRCSGALASAYRGLGELENAVELQAATLRVARQSLGPTHNNTRALHQNFADLLIDVEKFDEAEEELRKLLIILKGADTNALALADARTSLAKVLIQRRQFDEAESLLKETQAAIVSSNGRDQRQLEARSAEVSATLVQLYNEWGKPEEAERWQTPPKSPESRGSHDNADFGVR